MNQILSVEMQQQRKKSKKLGKKTIVMMFAIILLIFGISVISLGVSLQLNKDSINQVASDQGSGSNGGKIPSDESVDIEVIQKESTLKIEVKTDVDVEKVVYKWNNGKEEQVNAKKFEIQVPRGKENLLDMTATDVNGAIGTHHKIYAGAYQPEIVLSHPENGKEMTINCISDVKIDYISYSLDDGEVKTQKVDDVKANIPIEGTENVGMNGEHSLTILVVNEEGEKYESKRIADMPEIAVGVDEENFIIEVKDAVDIEKIVVDLNGDKKEFEVNDKYCKELIKLEDGENKLIVEAYNSVNVQATKRIKYNK